MKINLVILEKDKEYLSRLVNVFNTKYADKLEIYSFTDFDSAMESIDDINFDVFLVGDGFNVRPDMLSKKCGFAYFVGRMNKDRTDSSRIIQKYQKPDLIYKQILDIYSDTSAGSGGLDTTFGDKNSKLIVFTSPCGGCGTSSMAAACAINLSTNGKKILYLNLEKFGMSDSFFSGDGQFDLSDVIFALKSRKTNLSLKLESCVKHDPCGVYFFSQCIHALDIVELTGSDIIQLLSEIARMGVYDAIILDKDFSLDKDSIDILSRADAIVWVSDGTDISNVKIRRAYDALTIMEQNTNNSLINKTLLAYNKFSSKGGKMIDDIGIRKAGGAPRYAQATVRQVVGQLATTDIFDKIME